jgi:hypothetical protein
MKHNGQTIHTVAEFVREATYRDRHPERSFPRHGTKYISAMVDSINRLPNKSHLDRARVVRISWNGTSHERLLYEVGHRKSCFCMPQPYSRRIPPPPNDLEVAHRISVQSCGVDLWPRNWRKRANDLSAVVS